MLSALGRTATRWAGSTDPWTNVYGLGRTFLALGTAGTLAANAITTIFRPATGMPQAPICVGPTRLSLFCAVPSGQLSAARWLAVALLLLVASGWRPRITGVLHWWVSFSLYASGLTVDGGDHITGVLVLLLVPITLTDPRRWHWQEPPAREPERLGRQIQALIAVTTLWIVRLQVSAIYFHAAVGKMKVEQWADGTAAYYWFTDPGFGAAPWLLPLLTPLLRNGITVSLLTWGAMALELLLFMAIAMPRRVSPRLLVPGIVFHFVIAMIHGLISFWFAMTAALILYLRPPELPFRLPVPAWMRPRRAASRALVREEVPSDFGACSGG